VRNSPLVLVIALAATSCSTSRPCADAGDTSWPLKIKGDRSCAQKKISGKWVNHGSYVQKHENGKLALDGQFVEGKKHGIWIEYNDKGEKVRERRYENGVELSSKE
jgi:hypothetical protein